MLDMEGVEVAHVDDLAPKSRKRSMRFGAQTLPVRATGKAGGSK
jgi:hypothetical protein